MNEKLADVPTIWAGVRVRPDDAPEDKERRTAEFLRTVCAGVTRRLLEVTIPIAKKSGTKTEHHGSGVLLRIAGDNFLVTAAHILLKKLDHGVPLYIPESRESAIALAGDVAVPRENERFDVGAVRLPQQHTIALEAMGFKFLRMDETHALDPSRVPDGGYAVFGYPDELTIPHPDTIEPTPMYYGCTPFRESTSHLGGFDPSLNLALALKKEARHTFTGVVGRVPETPGMSGCSICFAYRPDQIITGWRPEDARVVGIQSGIFPTTGVLMGVSWAVVEQLIRFHWKDLGTALDIIAPSSSLVRLIEDVGFAVRRL